jgi:hypothetical protein
MVLLGDEAQVDAHFSLFGDTANLDARLVHGFALNIPHAQKSFWAHPIEHLGDLGHVESHFGPFGESKVLEKDRCMACAERTIGLKIVLDTPDRTPW